MHRHKARTHETRPFFGAVKQPQNQKAHGNVCEIARCGCGAVRKTNVNGRHIERGQWEK